MYYDLIICGIAAFLVGCFVTVVTMTIADAVAEKREAKNRKNPFEWCKDGCRHYEECFSKQKDPDMATTELVDKYCIGCPVEKAYEMMEAERNGY